MIKLKLFDGRLEIFNLKNFDREKAFYCAWHSMRGNKKFKNKLFRIMTDTGEKLEIKLGQISECEFSEIIYVRVKPSDVQMNIKSKKKGRRL
jgi:hypothetical protein